MEPLEKGELITLDNKKEYLVVGFVKIDNQKYVYLKREVLEKEDFEVLICREIIDEENLVLEPLTNQEEIDEVVEKFLDGVD